MCQLSWFTSWGLFTSRLRNVSYIWQLICFFMFCCISWCASSEVVESCCCHAISMPYAGDSKLWGPRRLPSCTMSGVSWNNKQIQFHFNISSYLIATCINLRQLVVEPDGFYTVMSFFVEVLVFAVLMVLWTHIPSAGWEDWLPPWPLFAVLMWYVSLFWNPNLHP